MAYGFGTRSWIRSTEFRQMKKARQEATAAYEAEQHGEVELTVACNCRAHEYPHIHPRTEKTQR